MTRYTVTWTVSARDSLAEVWMIAHDRGQVTLAADEIEAQLAFDPDTKGVKDQEEVWVICVPPLRAIFELSKDDRLVTIWDLFLEKD